MSERRRLNSFKLISDRERRQMMESLGSSGPVAADLAGHSRFLSWPDMDLDLKRQKDATLNIPSALVHILKRTHETNTLSTF